MASLKFYTFFNSQLFFLDVNTEIDTLKAVVVKVINKSSVHCRKPETHILCIV